MAKKKGAETGVRCQIVGEKIVTPDYIKRFGFQIDFFYGDFMTQPAQNLTVFGVPNVQTSSGEDLWAWKLYYLVEFEYETWRSKDLYDLAQLSNLDFDTDKLRHAAEVAFKSRRFEIKALSSIVVDGHWEQNDESALNWERFIENSD